MIIKIGEEYYRILLNRIEIKDKKVEYEIVKMLKWIKFTIDELEDYVCGDDMSYLDTSDSARIKIYEKVAWKFGYYLSFQKLENQEPITIL